MRTGKPSQEPETQADWPTDSTSDMGKWMGCWIRWKGMKLDGASPSLEIVMKLLRNV